MKKFKPYVIVYNHRGFTTQIPPVPVYVHKSRWKYVVLLVKLLIYKQRQRECRATRRKAADAKKFTGRTASGTTVLSQALCA